jgi:type IV secretion system protein TrbJ
MKTSILCRHASCALACAALLAAPMAPAQAQVTVFDPSNYAQALKTVSQSLKQIQAMETQIQQDEAMIAALPSNVTAPFFAIEQQTNAILTKAQGIGYGAANIAKAYSTAYPQTMTGQSSSQIAVTLANLQGLTRQAQQDAMQHQNLVVQSQPTTSSAVSSAITASQGASGQTSAIQATNQLLAALSTQLMQLQTLILTQARAETSAAAEQQAVTAAAQAESARATAYTPPASRISGSGHL